MTALVGADRGRAVKALVKQVVKPLTAPVGSLREIGTRAAEVALTYDDGPQPGGTDRVLAALARHGATATFFVLVERAERHPGLLAEVLAAGHEVGLHGIDHARLTEFSAQEVRRRTVAGRRRLEDLTGRPVRWFRSPYGAQTPATWLAIRRSGLTPVVWGPTGHDWLDDPAPEIAARALTGADRGAIVLLHDGYAEQDAGGEPAFDRGELAGLVLDGLAERGLRARSLTDCLAAGTPRHRAWFRR